MIRDFDAVMGNIVKIYKIIIMRYCMEEICPMEYGDSDGGIEKNKGLEYIKEIPHNSKIKIIFENN